MTFEMIFTPVCKERGIFFDISIAFETVGMLHQLLSSDGETRRLRRSPQMASILPCEHRQFQSRGESNSHGDAVESLASHMLRQHFDINAATECGKRAS